MVFEIGARLVDATGRDLERGMYFAHSPDSYIGYYPKDEPILRNADFYLVTHLTSDLSDGTARGGDGRNYTLICSIPVQQITNKHYLNTSSLFPVVSGREEIIAEEIKSEIERLEQMQELLRGGTGICYLP